MAVAYRPAQLSGSDSYRNSCACIDPDAMLHEARHQDPNNDAEYYKARFSIMPRTVLSAMYDALTGEDKNKYKKLVDDRIDNIYSFNDTASPDRKFETRIQKATKEMENTNRLGFGEIFASIINQENRKPKTMKSKKAANTDNELDILT